MRKKKICFLMDGCSGHRGYFRQILKSVEKKYSVCPLPKDADVILLFTCGFTKGDTTLFLDSLLYLSDVKREEAILIISGCGIGMYDKDDLESLDFVDYVFDYDESIPKICEVLKVQMKVDFVSGVDEFIGKLELEITRGCAKKNGYCSFCKCHYLGIPAKTMYTVEEVCNLVKRYKSPILVLHGLNTTIYRDGDNRLHDLLREVSKIETLKWIEVLCVASSGIYPGLIEELANNPKIYSVNYFPQSGSNHMLEKMNIGSTVVQNEYVLSRLKGKCISDAGFVVGHPGENVKDLRETIDFIRRNNLWFAVVSPYEISLDTPSYYMKQLPRNQYLKHIQIIKNTITKMTYTYLETLIGTRINGFIESISINKDGSNSYNIRPLNFFGMINVYSKRIECFPGDSVSVEIETVIDYENPVRLRGKNVEVL